MSGYKVFEKKISGENFNNSNHLFVVINNSSFMPHKTNNF